MFGNINKNKSVRNRQDLYEYNKKDNNDRRYEDATYSISSEEESFGLQSHSTRKLEQNKEKRLNREEWESKKLKKENSEFKNEILNLNVKNQLLKQQNKFLEIVVKNSDMVLEVRNEQNSILLRLEKLEKLTIKNNKEETSLLKIMSIENKPVINDDLDTIIQLPKMSEKK